MCLILKPLFIIKRAVINSIFIYPLYKKRVNIIYKVFYMGAFRTFIALF